MQFDREKLKSLVLYTCSKCEPEHMGAVKLHKVLYYSDMIAYAVTGQPITGATYRKRPLGPTCDALLSTLSDMRRDGQIEIGLKDYFGYLKREYLPKASPDLSRFSARELSLVDDVIEFVCLDNTAKTISEFSHSRAWDMAEFGEILPYMSAFYMFPTQVSKEALDWAEGEAESLAAERSEPNSLGCEDYAAFRSRVLGAV